MLFVVQCTSRNNSMPSISKRLGYPTCNSLWIRRVAGSAEGDASIAANTSRLAAMSPKHKDQ
eukprot:12014888-Heterocapsa_arctica.AAC.1